MKCNAMPACIAQLSLGSAHPPSFLSWQALFYNESLAAVIDRVQIAAILFVFCFTEPTLAQDRRLIMQRTELQCTALQFTASSMQIGGAVHCSFTVHWCGATYQQHLCTLCRVQIVHTMQSGECSAKEAVCADNPEKLLLIVLLLHFQYFIHPQLGKMLLTCVLGTRILR